MSTPPRSDPGKPARDHADDEDRVELEPLRLVHRHHLHAGPLGGRRALPAEADLGQARQPRRQAAGVERRLGLGDLARQALERAPGPPAAPAPSAPPAASAAARSPQPSMIAAQRVGRRQLGRRAAGLVQRGGDPRPGLAGHPGQRAGDRAPGGRGGRDGVRRRRPRQAEARGRRRPAGGPGRRPGRPRRAARPPPSAPRGARRARSRRAPGGARPARSSASVTGRASSRTARISTACSSSGTPSSASATISPADRARLAVGVGRAPEPRAAAPAPRAGDEALGAPGRGSARPRPSAASRIGWVERWLTSSRSSAASGKRRRKSAMFFADAPRKR